MVSNRSERYAERQEQQNVEQKRIEESFRLLKDAIERRAKEMGRSYQEELKVFLDLGLDIKPEIRERLMSEVET